MSVDRLEVVPVAVVGGYTTVIELPIFSVSGLTWKGASEIVKQFNFTNTLKFFVLQRPQKPTGANFVPCLKYRIGSTVYRYKLWEDEDCILDVPLYNNEIIRPNFVIEIWSISTSTSVNNLRPLYLYTNRTVLPDNAAEDLIYKFPDGTGVDLNSGINIPIASFTPGVTFSHYIGNFTNGVPSSTPPYRHTEVIDTQHDNALTTPQGDVFLGLFYTDPNRQFKLTEVLTNYTTSYAPTYIKCIFGFFRTPTDNLTAAYITNWFYFDAGNIHIVTRGISVDIPLPTALTPVMYVIRQNLTSVSIYIYDCLTDTVLYDGIVYTAFAELTDVNYSIYTSDTMAYSLYVYEHGFLYEDSPLTMAELCANYLDYIKKYYFLTINGLNWDNAAVAWLDNDPDDTAYTSITAVSATATQQRLNVFNELLIQDQTTGLYYAYKTIIVDGVPTLQIDPNPITI